jgi:hemolysin III
MDIHAHCPVHVRLRQSHAEEIANGVTHGIGLALSVAGAVYLMGHAAGHADAWYFIGCAVYVASLVAVYAASTASHVFHRPRLKRVLRMWDQAFIYLLIVGTYTPVALTYLREGWWWAFTAAMWGVALAGFFSKIIAAHRVDAVSVALYVLLGWAPLLVFRPMMAYVPYNCMWWMFVGGLYYTVGTFFLVLDAKFRYFHSVWHLFVIVGSACHYFAILLHVAPTAA